VAAKEARRAYRSERWSEHIIRPRRPPRGEVCPPGAAHRTPNSGALLSAIQAERRLGGQALSKLPVVATKLLPKEARRQPAAERRGELNLLLADYLVRGGEITICRPETASAQLKKQKPKTKMGRPPIGERPMTAAERKRRSRAKWKQPTPAAPYSLAKCPVPRLVPDRAVGAGFLIKDEA
jgi:hypothetical protein